MASKKTKGEVKDENPSPLTGVSLVFVQRIPASIQVLHSLNRMGTHAGRMRMKGNDHTLFIKQLISDELRDSYPYLKDVEEVFVAYRDGGGN